MIRWSRVKRLAVIGSCLALALTGCAFQGLNSLPLPGAVGRGPDAVTYHVEVPNVATLESNSPVLINDVVVGSVGKMTVENWHADVEVSVKPDVTVPANAVATVGQTSLLGSMHLALNPPLGQKPSGKLNPGATIPLSQSSTYPTTEQTLSSLSTVVTGGGLGQIGDIVHNFSSAVSGREPQIRELLTRLDNFVGVLDAQRDNIVASIQQLNRVAGTFAGQRDVIDRALKEIPPALDVLIKERPQLTTALTKLGEFSDTAAGLVNDAGDDLVTDLKNLEPALKALVDIGPDLSSALIWATAFPY
jgi:phospholipid/cholesterol/gamma-HCH transport system substrate-binding protein